MSGMNPSGGSSASMVTTNSSLRKSLPSSVDQKCKPGLKAGSSRESCSSSTSLLASLKPKPRLEGSGRNYDNQMASSKVSCSITSNLRGNIGTKRMENREIKDESFKQDRKSWSSKSSVGSSNGLGCKLEGAYSISKAKEKRRVESGKALRSVSTSKRTERQTPDGISSSKLHKKVADVTLIRQESESQGLGSNISRKPLGLLDESRPVKDKVVIKPKRTGLGSTQFRKPLGLVNESKPVKDKVAIQSRLSAAAGQINLVTITNKKNTTQRMIQEPKALKPRETHLMNKNGFSTSKGKSYAAQQVTNVTSRVPRFFR